jgi:hypothetical protein
MVIFNQPRISFDPAGTEGGPLIYAHRIHGSRRPKRRIATRKKLRKHLWKRAFSFDDGGEAGG